MLTDLPLLTQLEGVFRQAADARDEAPWPYNTYTFETERNGWNVWVQIAPAYGEFKARVRLGEREVSSVDIGEFVELKVFEDGDREGLQVVLGDQRASSVFIVLQPEVRLIVSMTGWGA